MKETTDHTDDTDEAQAILADSTVEFLSVLSVKFVVQIMIHNHK